MLILLVLAVGMAVAVPDADASIAFISRRTPAPQVFVMQDDGSGLRQFTDVPISAALPGWSADGQSIGYSSARADDGSDIYVTTLDGKRTDRLTNRPTSDSRPRWSPDGASILFQSNRGFNWEVQLMTPEGEDAREGVTNLTQHPAADGGGSWSPDGAKVVFASERDGGDSDVYTMDVGTRVVQRLTETPGFDGHAAWSPDGRHIAFTSQRGEHYGLYVMDADGQNVRALAKAVGPETRYDGQPSWSPDGARIAFISNRDHLKWTSYEIYTMDADGTDTRRLTGDPALSFQPAWSPHAARRVDARRRHVSMWGWLKALDQGRR